MSAVLIRNARVLTMLAQGETRPPKGGRRGRDLGTLGVVPSGCVFIENGRIAFVHSETDPESSWRHLVPSGTPEKDIEGRVLMPGFVDGHTHACWAGSRIDEWERKLAGATYQQIMAAGGGIMSTVRAVRQTNGGQLGLELERRINRMVRLGSTTIEVKSGYGLHADYELRMLRAIRHQRCSREATIVPTALLGHAVDPEAGSSEEFVRATIEQTLPRVSTANPGISVDAFCEKGAWSVADCVRLFEKAKACGHPIRVHADQFTSMGMIAEAIRLGARSVDHLEAATHEDLKHLAQSDTFGVILPVCGFHLDGRYANGRAFLDNGGKLAIATNYNPGSAPSPSMPFAIAIAVRHCGLAIPEAIVAATLNPAILLGFADRGFIAPGARADLLVLRHWDERMLAFEVGDNHVRTVILGGVVKDLWRGVS
jgi:imidazolonepropionase